MCVEAIMAVMNVLMITSDADVLRDGSPRQSELKEQAKLAHRLMVVVMNSHHHRSYPRKVTETLWLFPTNSWIPFFRFFGALKVIRREIFFRNKLQADLIVANDPFFSAFSAVIASRRYRKPLHIYVPQNIFSFYYVTHSPISLFKSIMARVFIGFADSVSAASEVIRAALIRQDPVFATRVTSVAPYIDVEATQAESIGEDLHMRYTQFRALLLVVAPLMPEHNVKLAIDVLAQVSQYRQHIGLVIVGHGWGKLWLRRYAAYKGVKHSVMFETPREDQTSYYKSAFALLVPSFFDEFETTIEDAAAAGCVIISSPVGNAPKIIKNKDNGFLCNPNNMMEYADAVSTLLDNESLRTQMRKKTVESLQKFMLSDKSAHTQSRKKAWESAITAAKGY